MKYVNAECEFCRKDFQKTVRRFNESNRNGWKHFCSRDCHARFRDTSVEVACGTCAAPVKRYRSELEKSKSGLLFCNKSCAIKYNNHVLRSGKDNPNFINAELETEGVGPGHYRAVCFLYHEKACVVCNECNIVEVHHFDLNHDNNHPTNLIPVCPTHHKYFHSRFRYLVEGAINEYYRRYLEASLEKELVPLLEDDEPWEDAA